MRQTIICNGCGREIYSEQMDYLKIRKDWGYFSRKDLEIHEINLCEECYDRIFSDLQIPAAVTEETEVL